MPTKWSYEALMVHQFKENNFEYSFYEIEKKISNTDFKVSYYIPELSEYLKVCEDDFRENGKLTRAKGKFEVLRNELIHESKINRGIPAIDENLVTADNFNLEIAEKIKTYFSTLNNYYLEQFADANRKKNNHISYLIENQKHKYYSYLDKYHNESVADQVRKIYERKKIVEYKGRLVRKIDPVFMDPDPESFIGIRSHFFAPRKYFMGKYYDTFSFNIAVIWFLTLVMYITLYYDILKKLINLSLPKFKKS
jgi:hypothetical protein